jgi:hypothetical protein
MGDRMKRFIEGEDRKQVALLPECLDDFVAEDNPVRIIEAFVEELDLGPLGFNGAMPSTTGRPANRPDPDERRTRGPNSSIGNGYPCRSSRYSPRGSNPLHITVGSAK